MALKDLHKNGALPPCELDAAIKTYSRNLHWYEEFAEAFVCDRERLRKLKRYRKILYPSTLRSLLQHARNGKSIEIYEFAQECRKRFSLKQSPLGHASPKLGLVLDFQFADTERYLGLRASSDEAFNAMRDAVADVLNPDLGMAGSEAVESALWGGRPDYVREAKTFIEEEHHTFAMDALLAYARSKGRSAMIEIAGSKPEMNSPLNDSTALLVGDMPLVGGLLETAVNESQKTHLDPAAFAEAVAPFDVVSAAVLFAAAGDDEKAQSLDAARKEADLNTDRFAAFALGDYESDAWLYSNLDCINRLLHFERLRERFVRDREVLKLCSGAALAPAIDAMAALEMTGDKQASSHLKDCIKAVSGDPATRDATFALIVRLALHRDLPFAAYKAAQKITKRSTSYSEAIAAVARSYATLGDVAGAMVVAERLSAGQNIISRTADGAIFLAAFRQLQ